MKVNSLKDVFRQNQRSVFFKDIFIVKTRHDGLTKSQLKKG